MGVLSLIEITPSARSCLRRERQSALGSSLLSTFETGCRFAGGMSWPALRSLRADIVAFATALTDDPAHRTEAFRCAGLAGIDSSMRKCIAAVTADTDAGIGLRTSRLQSSPR
jgi:hypothetical protein